MAMACLVAGGLLLCIEFCRPGWVLFGVGGGVLLVVGGFHLSVRSGGWLLAGLLTCWTILALASFGVWPRWVGWIATLAMPLLAWRLEAHPALVLPMVGATWWLLGIASRALSNKTGLE